MYAIHCVKYHVLDVAKWSRKKICLITIYNNIALNKHKSQIKSIIILFNNIIFIYIIKNVVPFNLTQKI